jgi:multiple sugar transport system substrate-binding protein
MTRKPNFPSANFPSANFPSANFPNVSFSRRGLLGAALGATGLALAGCGSDDKSPSTATASKVDVTAELQKPAALTVWTWGNWTEQVALFTKKYPNIKVNLVNAGQGSAEYTKLRTALQAKSGLPDVVQLEYNHLPGFSITEALQDLTPYGAADLSSTFDAAVWKRVTGDGKVWALPTDGGPMGMLYRADILDKHGIAVPTTWTEFADAARKLHTADPNAYLTNFPPTDTGSYFGLAWQAGSHPYTVKSRTELTIGLNDAGAKKLVEFWQPLIDEGVVSVDADFTDQWFKGLSSGRYASWLTGAWGPYFLTTSAADTAGKWRVAQLPQWTAGANESGYWGGSSLAVVNGSKSAAAAAGLIQFLTTDPQSTQITADKQHQYPVTTALLSDTTFLDKADPFYGGQKVNQVFAKIGEGVNQNFNWGPLEEYVASSVSDTLGKVITAKGNLTAGLDAWQQSVVAYGKKQGFTIQG